MRDADFKHFIGKFGEAQHRSEVPDGMCRQWRDKLPNQLLEYWRDEGWCGYGNGIFWTVNPGDYDDLVDEWLADNPLEQIDAFHVIARSAFGKLYLCGERCGRSVTISCPLNAISALAKDVKPKSPEHRDLSIKTFFSMNSPAKNDVEDEYGEPLFERAVRTLGALAPDEMYGFEPALVAGGKMRLEGLQRVKLDQHLTILRQFAAPAMPFSNIDIEALKR
ncbi:GAD-like domain-containing protein [Aquabacterium sp.]|uniref:GAD-like domain-containing protein n=1 Tax=Aquabacterium sp. TaxID=1872578 RepID=UPI002B55720A|nr:GAD-like domain-containing protein [Aquabacterium sp.]HSW04161.1 GAD-like domain-containing protein [Aquabacterium sp.]